MCHRRHTILLCNVFTYVKNKFKVRSTDTVRSRSNLDSLVKELVSCCTWSVKVKFERKQYASSVFLNFYLLQGMKKSMRVFVQTG